MSDIISLVFVISIYGLSAFLLLLVCEAFVNYTWPRAKKRKEDKINDEQVRLSQQLGK